MAEEERIFNGQLFASEVPEARNRVLRDLPDSVGEGTWRLGPIHFHYGCHTRVGEGCFMNFNFTVQDDARVTIGDHCSFGPNVTPLHPMLGSERRGVVF